MNQDLNETSYSDYKGILNNLLDAVLVVDKEGVIIYANRAAGNIFSTTVENLTGAQFGYPVMPGEIQELKIIRKSEVLIAQMLVSSVKWKTAEAKLISLRDITDLKKISRELKSQKKQLELLNDELKQYANVSSHDLKEPVRKILIYSDILLRDPDNILTTDSKKKLEKIASAAEGMKKLITGIAEYSRLGMSNVTFEEVNINRVINDVITDLELKIKDTNANVNVGYIPKIESIPLQMHQLFLNLVSNSIKYSLTEVPPVIKIWSEEDEETVTINVSDNGIGFDEKFSEKILQPFTRLHSKEFEGSGIGLAICKKILDIHKANLYIQSTPGKGSTFRMVFKKYQD